MLFAAAILSPLAKRRRKRTAVASVESQDGRVDVEGRTCAGSTRIDADMGRGRLRGEAWCDQNTIHHAPEE